MLSMMFQPPSPPLPTLSLSSLPSPTPMPLLKYFQPSLDLGKNQMASHSSPPPTFQRSSKPPRASRTAALPPPPSPPLSPQISICEVAETQTTKNSVVESKNAIELKAKNLKGKPRGDSSQTSSRHAGGGTGVESGRKVVGSDDCQSDGGSDRGFVQWGPPPRATLQEGQEKVQAEGENALVSRGAAAATRA
jgi:hypothetical protein